MSKTRKITVTFKESEFCFWAFEKKLNPEDIKTPFSEILKDGLRSYFFADFEINFDDHFWIEDSAYQEQQVEERLNDIFFILEEDDSWLTTT